MSTEKREPKEVFFDLSKEFYERRFTKNDLTKINVQSYIESPNNLVREMQVDIVSTNQGCIPYVKTFEVNYNNQRKFVKAIKFYNSRVD